MMAEPFGRFAADTGQAGELIDQMADSLAIRMSCLRKLFRCHRSQTNPSISATNCDVYCESQVAVLSAPISPSPIFDNASLKPGMFISPVILPISSAAASLALSSD